jgi:predicted ATP-dependent protease
VLIPESNVQNLMLREDVRRAVEEGNFNIYAVSHVDKGIEILTGIAAGARQEDGTFPEGTINHKVVAKIEKMARRQRKFSTPLRSTSEDDAENGDGGESDGKDPDGA